MLRKVIYIKDGLTCTSTVNFIPLVLPSGRKIISSLVVSVSQRANTGSKRRTSVVYLC